jgi:ATP-binding cassette subfamily C protein
MLAPLLQLVGLDVQQGTLGKVARLFSGLLLAVGLRPTLSIVLGMYVLVMTSHALLHRWQTTVVLTLQHDLVAYFRARLYRAIVNDQWLFLARNRCSDFTHALTAETDRIGEAVYSVLHMLATATVTLAYVLLALKLSAPMTALALVCGGGLMFFLRRRTAMSRVAGENLSKATNGLYSAIAEHLGGK